MKKLLAVAAVAASMLLVVSAEAKTCVWTGAGANGKWTNPDNWKDGEIPGRITVSSVLSGEGGDIAEFGAVAAGAKTTIDMTGVTSIGGVKVVGEDAPAYTFGTSTADAQQLKLEAEGSVSSWAKASPMRRPSRQNTGSSMSPARRRP